MSINRGRMTTTEGAHASLVGILSLLLFLSWWRALKRRSNHPETVWIPLEARHLNSFKNSFKETCKYVFLYILDDRIICYWRLGILNVRFNVFSAAFDVLIKILESYRRQIPSRASSQWTRRGSCMNWLKTLTAYTMSGRVTVRYINLPNNLR